MINKLRRLIRDYFGFSRVETNGFIVLVPLMVLMLFLPGVYVSLFSKEYNPHDKDFAVMDSLMTVWNEVVEVKKEKPEFEALPVAISLSPFDPNTVNLDEMRKLGIPDFLGKRIDNYRAKGGQFRLKKDLVRIYDFPDSLYQVLKDYIDLPENYARKKKDSGRGKSESIVRDSVKKSKYTFERKPLWIDLSKADTTTLKKLKGIGPSFSKRIVKYRDLLGGFVDKGQLKEVYGLSDSLYFTLSDQLYISQPDSVGRIALNIANFKKLSSHPYISYKVAREIIQLRSKRGKFRSLKDLMVVSELDSAQVKRLAPYISF